MKKRKVIKIILLFLLLLGGLTPISYAAGRYEIGAPQATAVPCNPATCTAQCDCGNKMKEYHKEIKEHMGLKFREHRDWMIETYFTDNILLAMKQMTQQMTVIAMQQMKIVGTFFDAKHQMETQRLFQQLMAEAHKDYQPSEGMCDVGTNVRGLLTAQRKANLAHQTLANRVMSRQLRTGENLTLNDNTDLYSRVDMFKKTFCSTKDNANGLRNICIGKDAPKVNINRDVDYTRTVETDLTLEIDFSKDGAESITEDEKATFALTANLFAHKIMPHIGRRVLADENGNPKTAAYKYLDLRAVAAKRSVAQNSINAIIAERANGDPATEYAPFLKSVIVELGIPKDVVNFTLGENPSYFAQMEVLTKKLYQNPVFYTELYDKPTNVLRKRAAIRATNLMQDRDFYKSLLRTETVLSVLLESMLNEEHDRVYSHLNRLRPDEEAAHE